MLRKIIALFLALAVLLCAFAGCASKPEVVSSGEASAMVEPAEVPAEEPADMLSGSWTPQGAVYRNTVIDLSDNESLSSMYSGTALTFSEGNTFSYYNMFIYTGTYELYSENIYHLQTEEVTWLSVDENGASEKPMTKATSPHMSSLCWTKTPFGLIFPGRQPSTTFRLSSCALTAKATTYRRTRHR